MSSPSMLYAETAGVFFFLAASIINAYTLSKIKRCILKIFYGSVYYYRGICIFVVDDVSVW